MGRAERREQVGRIVVEKSNFVACRKDFASKPEGGSKYVLNRDSTGDKRLPLSTMIKVHLISKSQGYNRQKATQELVALNRPFPVWQSNSERGSELLLAPMKT